MKENRTGEKGVVREICFVKGNKMTTEERLEKIERELAAAKRCNHWLLTIVVLTVGGLGLVWTLTKTMPAAYAQEAEAVQKVIRANGFVLVDEKGKERAVLAVVKSVPRLSLFDENGKPRAGLGVDKDGPRLSLFDENGKPRAGLSVPKDGPMLSLWDENGKTARVVLAVTKDGPALALVDENGMPRVGLNVSEDMPQLILFDEKVNPRAGMIVMKDGPQLVFSDENRKPIWSAP